MAVVGVIPARFDSVRFPGKVLAEIGGKPMIRHVYERASQATRLDRLIVATDDQRIKQVVEAFGGQARMTRRDHTSGSDRAGEVARQIQADYVVNIQGDEPFISPAAIDSAVLKLQGRPDAMVATLVRKFADAAELRSRHTAKVILDRNDNALYFSRAAIPFNREEARQENWLAQHDYYQHIGLYVFRRDFLLEFISWPEGRLERVEKLEQLRILEHGFRIVCAITDYESLCVDTPDDLLKAQHFWKEHFSATAR